MSSTDEKMSPTARRRLLAMGVILSFSSIFQMGYANAYPNTAIDSFRQFINNSMEEKKMSPEEFNWIWSAIINIYFIGFAFGSCLSVPMADRIGRKWCLVIGNFSNVASSIIFIASIYFSLPVLFVTARFLFSIAAAISMNSLILLLQESSPESMKGLMSFNAEMAFVVTNLVGALAGMRIVLGNNLVVLVGLSLPPALFSLVMSLCLHESPKYLKLTKNKPIAAQKALFFYQRIDESHSIQLSSSAQNEKQEEKSSIKSILSTKHTMIGLALGILTLQLTSSIWPILYYSTEFLTRTGIAAELAETCSTVMLFLSGLSTILGMFLVEKHGRKVLLLSAATVNVCALLLFVLSEQLHNLNEYIKYGCIIAIILHGISYSIALGPIAWFLTAELVILPHRAFCQSLALTINQLLSLALCFVTLPLYNKIGSLVILLLYVIPGAVAILILVCRLPETRGKSTEQVVQDIKKLYSKSKITQST